MKMFHFMKLSLEMMYAVRIAISMPKGLCWEAPCCVLPVLTDFSYLNMCVITEWAQELLLKQQEDKDE